MPFKAKIDAILHSKSPSKIIHNPAVKEGNSFCVQSKCKHTQVPLDDRHVNILNKPSSYP